MAIPAASLLLLPGAAYDCRISNHVRQRALKVRQIGVVI